MSSKHAPNRLDKFTYAHIRYDLDIYYFVLPLHTLHTNLRMTNLTVVGVAT